MLTNGTSSLLACFAKNAMLSPFAETARIERAASAKS
jgi:hypothetical protein